MRHRIPALAALAAGALTGALLQAGATPQPAAAQAQPQHAGRAAPASWAPRPADSGAPPPSFWGDTSQIPAAHNVVESRC